MGCKKSDELIIVTHVSFPGPKAIYKRRSITFDIDYCQHFVDKVYYESGGAITYIGDWHCHQSKKIKPSKTDFFTLKRESLNPESTECPIMLIVGVEKNFSRIIDFKDIYGFYYDRLSDCLREILVINELGKKTQDFFVIHK